VKVERYFNGNSKTVVFNGDKLMQFSHGLFIFESKTRNMKQNIVVAVGGCSYVIKWCLDGKCVRQWDV